MSKLLRRNNIVELALKLFLENGYSLVSMDDIADSVGISKKTLYNHFPGKSELFKETIVFFIKNYSDGAQRLLEDTRTNNIEKINIYLKHLSLTFAEMRSNAWSDIKKYVPEVYHEVLKKRRNILLRDLGYLIDGLKIEGMVKNPDDIELAIFMYIGSMELMNDEEYMARFPSGMLKNIPKTVFERADRVINLLFKGLLDDTSLEFLSEDVRIFKANIQ